MSYINSTIYYYNDNNASTTKKILGVILEYLSKAKRLLERTKNSDCISKIKEIIEELESIESRNQLEVVMANKILPLKLTLEQEIRRL